MNTINEEHLGHDATYEMAFALVESMNANGIECHYGPTQSNGWNFDSDEEREVFEDYFHHALDLVLAGRL